MLDEHPITYQPMQLNSWIMGDEIITGVSLLEISNNIRPGGHEAIIQIRIYAESR